MRKRRSWIGWTVAAATLVAAGLPTALLLLVPAESRPPEKTGPSWVEKLASGAEGKVGAPVRCTEDPGGLEVCFPDLDLDTVRRELERIGTRCSAGESEYDLECRTGDRDRAVEIRVTRALRAAEPVSWVHIRVTEGGLDVPEGAEQRLQETLDKALAKVVPVFFPQVPDIADAVSDRARDLLAERCPPHREGPVVRPGYRVGCTDPRVIQVSGPAGKVTDWSVGVDFGPAEQP
ncbi:hypothetical protein [Amycolatopsis cihanbeyliensis]|uniref:Uncharacterized protein n=1 Tax=Amycolatopsis cihanbeyliensis TaxID=1128664 RepID=A0A542DM18_AMYCI|nr:hypothetical protein [Amycolatopsis cihanbeyliensis]TQJ04143.1 hypothetical protein FB471_3925 [Amycolatopsis cihanbeyliensis]